LDSLRSIGLINLITHRRTPQYAHAGKAWQQILNPSIAKNFLARANFPRFVVKPRGAFSRRTGWASRSLFVRRAIDFSVIMHVTYFLERFADFNFAILIARTFFIIRRNVALSASESPAMQKQHQTIYELSSEIS
jgi:hypothetical protein